MLLALVIGNTNIHAGVFVDQLLVSRWRMATYPLHTADEYALTLSSFFEMWDLEASRIRDVVVASVVPVVENVVVQMSQHHWNVEPLRVSRELDLGLSVSYASPSTWGADRIANAVSASDQYGAPVISVDCGTATTIDVVSSEGSYLGGSIAAGIRISEEALVRSTAQLPEVPLAPPQRAIGDTTVTCLQAGLVLGHAALIDGLVTGMKAELAGNPAVIMTGGASALLAPLCRTLTKVDEDLTLRGLQILYRRNATNAARSSLRQSQSLA